MQRLLAGALLAALAAAAPASARERWSPSDALVYQWYSHFAPQHGLTDPRTTGWPQALDKGQPPQQVLASIIGSEEFWIRAGRTPEGFVETLFQDLTGRPPTRRELAYWEGRLQNTIAGAPDYEELHDLAYAMLARYPQAWQPAPNVAPPPGAAPGERGRDPRDWDRDDDYEYRRPDHRPYRPDYRP